MPVDSISKVKVTITTDALGLQVVADALKIYQGVMRKKLGHADELCKVEPQLFGGDWSENYRVAQRLLGDIGLK